MAGLEPEQNIIEAAHRNAHSAPLTSPASAHTEPSVNASAPAVDNFAVVTAPFAPSTPRPRSSGDSRSCCTQDVRSKPHILIIVTGGTICMLSNGIASSLKPAPFAERLLQTLDDPTLPSYDVFEWEELLDSSDVSSVSWVRICQDISKNYADYDGFVVLHGTDTLAYTACALSFMLENLNKPVILTGAMLPITHLQSDARRNLAVAMVVAAYSQVTEVCILFGSKLLRGNRARKLNCSIMDAFDSPNYLPLGKVGVDVTIDEQLLLPPSKRGFRVFSELCLNIVIVMVTPNLSADLLKHLFHSPTRPLGVILQLYGTGTLPVKGIGRTLLHNIKKGIEEGVDVMAVSQCPSGTCSLLTYENGALLYDLGVIEGKDMTPEAAFAKMAYLMGKGFHGKQLKVLMEKNIRGELTDMPTLVTGQATLCNLSASQLSG